MPNTSKENVIQQRLEMLQAHYHAFSLDENAQICLWQIEAAEIQMIESFFRNESTVFASSPDLFLKFERPFHQKSTYARSLFDELVEHVTDYRSEPADHKVKINWQPRLWSRTQQSQPDFFFVNLSEFAKGIEELEDKVLAYLAPPEVLDFKKLEDWLIDILEIGLPSNLQIMLVDFVDNPQFSKLSKAFPKKVKTIVPQLQMQQAMKEIAMAAGGNSPGAHFQNHFIDLTHAAAKGNMEKVERASNKAMQIAIEQGWTHLQIAVLTTVGSAWMGKNEFKKALKEFESAENIARDALRREEDTASRLLSNCLFSKGTIFVHLKQHSKGAKVYEEIVPLLEKQEDTYMTMEAWRMAAYCFEKGLNYSKAIECNEKAMQLANQLEEEQRQNSTLPFIAAALIRLNKRRASFGKADDIEEEMRKIYGADWRSRITLKTN